MDQSSTGPSLNGIMNGERQPKAFIRSGIPERDWGFMGGPTFEGNAHWDHEPAKL